jgi:hypothetical protein
MVRIVQDIDRWLGECGTTVERDEADGTRLIGECTLPGHDGAHDDDGAGQLVAGRITGEQRDLADTVERVSQHFAWSAPAVDREVTDAPATVANGRDVLANLAVSLETIGRRTTRLAEKIRAIDLSPTPHSRAGPYVDVCHHPHPRPCRLVCDAPDGTAPGPAMA